MVSTLELYSRQGYAGDCLKTTTSKWLGMTRSILLAFESQGATPKTPRPETRNPPSSAAASQDTATLGPAPGSPKRKKEQAKDGEREGNRWTWTS